MSEITLLEGQLPLDKVGVRLRRAREAAGLSRAQVAANTRIPERHLMAIEVGDFAALPARAYAMGFSRSYARAVGLDETAIANDVRDELDGVEHVRDPRATPTFEPGDPARVPSGRFALIAALAALIVIAAGSVLWRSYYAPAVELPPITQAIPEATLPDGGEPDVSASGVAGLPTMEASSAAPSAITPPGITASAPLNTGTSAAPARPIARARAVPSAARPAPLPSASVPSAAASPSAAPSPPPTVAPTAASGLGAP